MMALMPAPTRFRAMWKRVSLMAMAMMPLAMRMR